MSRRNTLRRHGGFTLLELVITVALVALITAIALPSYNESVRKARRADARASLTTLAQRLERCYTQFGAYDDDDCDIASPQNSTEDHYQITVVRAVDTYTLTASPIGAQAHDSKCTSLILDEMGDRRATGSNTDECW